MDFLYFYQMRVMIDKMFSNDILLIKLIATNDIKRRF